MNWIMLAGILGFVGVGAGAFGAHAVKDSVTPERLAAFQTGVQYHLIHTLALLAADRLGTPGAAWCFFAGILLFSGSLYLLVLLDKGILGAVTPIGGVCFLAGWAWIAYLGFSSGVGPASGG